MGSVYGPNMVTDGLVSLYDAGNVQSYPGSGTTWYDLVGNSDSTSWTGDPTYSSANGGYFDLDDSPDYITIPHDSNHTAAKTWALWFNLNAIPTATSGSASYTMLFQKSANWNVATGILAHFIYGSLRFSWGLHWNSGAVIDQTTLSAATWYYFTGTCDGTTTADKMKIYLNGELKDTGTAGVVANDTSVLTIGAGNGGDMDGKIARFEIWSAELTAAQILQNFNAHKSRFGL